MGESDRGTGGAGTTSPEAFLDSVRDYLHAQGWDTTTNRLNASAVVVACAGRSRSDGPDRHLCLVETGADTDIGPKHLKYLISAGKKKDISSLSLTAAGGVGPAARRAADEYGVEIIQPDDIESNAAEFGLAAEDIDVPDPAPPTETADATDDEGVTPPSGRDDATDTDESPEIPQAQASLVEVLVMLLGSGLALLGLATFAAGIGTIVRPPPGVVLVTGIFIGFPATFVAVSAIDEYFNLHIFGSWRVRKENVAGVMGCFILLFGIFGNELCSTCSGSEFVFVGGVILLFYSAGIYVVRGFFEKRRGRR